jgi:hypothetical protein
MTNDAHLLARLDRIEDKLDDLTVRVIRAEGRRHAAAGVISALVSLMVGITSVWVASRLEAAEEVAPVYVPEMLRPQDERGHWHHPDPVE